MVDVLFEVVNGDPRQAFVLTHYCSGVACCRDREHSIKKVCAVLIATVLKTLPTVPIAARWMQPLASAVTSSHHGHHCRQCVVVGFVMSVVRQLDALQDLPGSSLQYPLTPSPFPAPHRPAALPS